MKILVTGGAGFIGSHITDRLVKDGHQVFVVDDLSSGKKENVNQSATFLELDIKDREKIYELFGKEKFETVIHAAAQKNVRWSVEDPQFDASVNIIGSLNLLEAGRQSGLKKFIFLSTGGAIYGNTEDRPTKEDHEAKPVCPYGIAKLSVESYLHFYQVQYNMDYVCLRLANVFGPRQDPKGEAGVVAIFFTKMLNGKQLVINGDGKQTRDYVYVGDVADAVVASIDQKETGVFNVGTSKETSVNSLFLEIARIAEREMEEKHGPALPGEQQTSSLAVNKIKKDFGWEPKVTLKEGLKLTYQWFYEQHEKL